MRSRYVPDTPPGIYDLEVVALDGVGGKKKFDFTVEITEEQVDGGNVEWFPLGTVPNDSDSDGVIDSADAFPDDPAASVDTDGDGKPDDWNEGKSASDSSSSPQLSLDNDDDNDQIVDSEDAYPYDWDRSELEGSKLRRCESNYCLVQTVEPVKDEIQYLYRVSSEAKDYEFLHAENGWALEDGGGSSSTNFDFFDGTKWTSYRDQSGSVADTTRLSLEALFQQSQGTVRLRLSEGSGLGWVALSLVKAGARPIVIFIMQDTGYRLSEFSQTARAVSFTRPEPGTGNHRNSDQCSTFDYEGMGLPAFSPFSFNLMSPSRFIPIGNEGRAWNLRAAGSEIFICADTPVGIYDLTFEVVDGAGGKQAFPLTIRIEEERVEGGGLNWFTPEQVSSSVASDWDCKNAYCVVSAWPDEKPGANYFYALSEGERDFPFEHQGFDLAPGPASGSGYSLNLGKGLDSKFLEFSNTLTGDAYERLRDAFRGDDYQLVTLSRPASRSSLWQVIEARKEDGEEVRVFLFDDQGGRVENLRQINSHIKVARPVEGTGTAQVSNSCTDFRDTWDLMAPGLLGRYGLAFGSDFPASPAQQVRWPYLAGLGHFYWCSDSPTGLFETSMLVMDGRGGKVEWPLTIEVTEEKAQGGAIEWFKSKAAAGLTAEQSDRDGDGVPDDLDAFPDDPAASVDTDEDGKPDDWNEGKTQADSTSDPALVLDDDDDNDGYTDSRDDFPSDINQQTEFTNDISECLSDYCVVIGGTAQYFFSLTSEFREYRFQHGLKIESIRWGGGNNTFAFDYENQQGAQTWSVDTEEGGSVEIDESFIPFKEALEWSEGRIRLRANQGFVNSGYEYIDLVTSQGVIRITVSATPPEPIGALNITQSALQFTPPTIGTGGSPNFGEDCAVFDNDQMFGRRLSGGALLFERSILGGSRAIGPIQLYWPSLDWWVVCNNVPASSFETGVYYIDGLGGKKRFDISVRLKSAETAGGQVEWFDSRRQMYDGEVCDSAFCVESIHGPQHYYALTDSLESYPFSADIPFSVTGIGGGNLEQWFAFGSEGQVYSSEASEQSGLKFTQYIAESSGSLDLRYLEGSGTLYSDSPPSLMTIHKHAGSLISNINQQYKVLEISRPEQGLGQLENGLCSNLNIGDIASPSGANREDLSINERVNGGIALLALAEDADAFLSEVFIKQYSGSWNQLYVCADDLTGTQELTIAALDGRGGQFLMPITLKVLESRSGAGSINWSNQTAADSDNDTVSDDVDAFPNDPAASVDTDGDGKPDDWNAGQTAADSTSDPVLVIDDDDDGDGVLDVDDAYPLDATRTIFDLDVDDVADSLDNCPASANTDQSDLDQDGLGDACDDDIDGDQCPNIEDAYPTDSKRCEVGVQKAIVVAGGGPYASNFLWEATERMAELSIKTLKSQGIAEEHIYYLSAGFGDAVAPDGPATADAVRSAILEWTQAGNPADDVLIYLVDHGGFEIFELGKKAQLDAKDLDSWLDELQGLLPGQLTVVYDACQSGSFVPVLRPDADQDRLVLTSSGSKERAHFAARGDVSFSFHFWSNFLIGGDIYRSFVAGDEAMRAIFNRRQNAEIEADGDGVANAKGDKALAREFSFGQGIALASDVPAIGDVSDTIFLDGDAIVEIKAFNVVGASEVVRVWALVDTPDEIILSVDEPLTNIDLIEFSDVDGDGNWTATYEDADTQGTYEFKVFAQNQDGLYSSPPGDGSNTVTVVQKSGRAPLIGKDSDQDGVLDQFDPFPSDPLYGADRDADFIPDEVDPDADGDGQRDEYQGKDIYEVPLEPELMSYLVQDDDEVFASFHDTTDVDRFVFIGLKGEELTLDLRAAADANKGPDLTLAIVDEAGAIQRVDGRKLDVDDALQAQAETLSFTVPATGRYIARVGQAQLQSEPGYVIGPQSGYGLLLSSNRTSLSERDVASDLAGLRYRAKGLAWQQPLTVTGAGSAEFSGRFHLLVSEGVTVIGYPENQCQFAEPVLSCDAEAGDTVVAQLLAESIGVGEIALYVVQNDDRDDRVKEPIAADNLKVLRFLVSDDEDSDGMPDDYERMRGTDPTVDDAFEDLDTDGISNIDEYLSGFDPLSLNADTDGDGRPDDVDAFPEDSAEWADFDRDGTGDNADLDDDGDGALDTDEVSLGFDPFDRFSCPSGCFSFDIDQSLDASPLTDGLLVIRFLFGFEGESLTNGAVGTAAERADAVSVATYLSESRQALDIDGDGDAKALTDGLLLIRYLFGFEGDALISGAIGRDATRKDAASVEAYIEARLGVGG